VGLASIARLAVLSIASLLAAQFTHAQTRPLQSLDSIRQSAELAVRSQLPRDQRRYHVSAQKLDSRLQLASCAVTLDAFVTSPQSMQTGHTTTGVRCQSGSQWTIYVSVAIETELEVFVAKSAMPRDAHLSMNDVEIQTRRVSGSATNFITTPEQLNDRRLKRPLSAGTALTADAFVADMVVRRGQQVALIADTGSFQVRASGKALNDGGIRDRVRVQNENSLKVVEGVVDGPGTVRVLP
jgi:flagellar basal body P-ring formation protein FlgA